MWFWRMTFRSRGRIPELVPIFGQLQKEAAEPWLLTSKELRLAEADRLLTIFSNLFRSGIESVIGSATRMR